MPNQKLLGVVIGLLGIILLIAGAYFATQQLAFLDRCLEAKAVVIDLDWEEEWVETEEGGYSTLVGWPVFQFVDLRTDEQVVTRGSVGSPDPPFSIGQEVEILYDPDNLSGPAIVSSFWDIWLLPIIFFFVATIFTLVGVLVILRR